MLVLSWVVVFPINTALQQHSLQDEIKICLGSQITPNTWISLYIPSGKEDRIYITKEISTHCFTSTSESQAQKLAIAAPVATLSDPEQCLLLISKTESSLSDSCQPTTVASCKMCKSENCMSLGMETQANPQKINQSCWNKTISMQA